MAQICYKWGDCDVLWKDANWWWSRCFQSPVPPVIPEAPIQPPGVDATTLIQPWLIEPWNPYRAGEIKKQGNRKMIEMLLTILGEEYSEKKEKKTINVDVGRIKIELQPTDIDLKLKD